MQNRRYNPSTLAWRKGKWYVQVTKPKELQFGSDKQARRSTGTSDKREAGFLQHSITQAIYEDFDKALKRTDPVFEALRPFLEAEGANARQWYEEGKVEVVVKGEKTLAFKAGGIAKIEDEDGKPLTLLERWVAEDHVNLLKIVTGLGHAIPAHVVDLLSPSVREEVMKAASASQFSPREVVELVNKSRVQRFTTNFLEYATRKPKIRFADSDKPSIQTKLTLADVLSEYLQSRPEKSRQRDKIQLDKWLKHKLGKRPLATITDYDAYEFLYEFHDDLTKSSVGVLRAAMSNVYNWARMQRRLEITNNPFRNLDLRKVGRDGIERRPYNSRELTELFELPMSEDDRIALSILLATGMRGGELMQMTGISVENGIRFLDVRQAKTKTKGSKRMVPLHDVIGDISFPLKTSQGKLNRIIKDKFDDEQLSLHSLRHTFKVLARDAGLTEEMHKFIMGHSLGDVSGRYGVGPSLKARYDAIMSIPFPWLVSDDTGRGP